MVVFVPFRIIVCIASLTSHGFFYACPDDMDYDE
jgi:hypothetical protein